MRFAVAEGLRFAIAAVWLFAAISKLRTPAVTRESVRRLLGGPRWVALVVAPVLPIGELLLGMLLVVGWHARHAAGLSALLFVLFAALMGRAAVRISLEGGGCGCFGAAKVTANGDVSDGPRDIARNLVLAALAVGAAGAA